MGLVTGFFYWCGWLGVKYPQNPLILLRIKHMYRYHLKPIPELCSGITWIC